MVTVSNICELVAVTLQDLPFPPCVEMIHIMCVDPYPEIIFDFIEMYYTEEEIQEGWEKYEANVKFMKQLFGDCLNK